MDTLERYERELAALGYARATIRAKVGVVRHLLSTADVEEPEDLTREDVVAWLGLSPQRADWTRIKYLAHVRAWCAWAGLEDLTDGLRRPRQPMGLPRPVSEHDLALVLGADTTPDRTRAWITLGAYCGLRSFETAKVEAADLLQGPEGWSLRVLGKGGRWGIVPAPPIVLEELEPWRAAAAGRLWEVTAGTVQAAIRAAGERAGVELTSHQLRHRYGTAVHQARGDLLITQQLMRHRSPATTAGYALVASARTAAVVLDLPGAQARQVGRPTLRVIPGG